MKLEEARRIEHEELIRERVRDGYRNGPARQAQRKADRHQKAAELVDAHGSFGVYSHLAMVWALVGAGVGLLFAIGDWSENLAAVGALLTLGKAVGTIAVMAIIGGVVGVCRAVSLSTN